MKLLSVGQDSKTKKSVKKGFLTGIMYLAPSNQAKVINTCPFASAGCRIACLYTAGMAGRFKKINEARVKRTLLFKENQNAFLAKLDLEIRALIRKAKREKLIPCVRLNGTSDISWENFGIFENHKQIQFYDYTKNPKRFASNSKANSYSNYHLTFSRSESNDKAVSQVLKNGGNVAVVFKKELPKTYLNRKVVSGDENDLRFLDEENVIVGLKAKGDAKKDKSGFVVLN